MKNNIPQVNFEECQRQLILIIRDLRNAPQNEISENTIQQIQQQLNDLSQINNKQKLSIELSYYCRIIDVSKLLFKDCILLDEEMKLFINLAKSITIPSSIRTILKVHLNEKENACDDMYHSAAMLSLIGLLLRNFQKDVKHDNNEIVRIIYINVIKIKSSNFLNEAYKIFKIFLCFFTKHPNHLFVSHFYENFVVKCINEYKTLKLNERKSIQTFPLKLITEYLKYTTKFFDKEAYDNFNIKNILIDIHDDIFSSIDEFWCALEEYDKLYPINFKDTFDYLYENISDVKNINAVLFIINKMKIILNDKLPSYINNLLNQTNSNFINAIYTFLYFGHLLRVRELDPHEKMIDKYCFKFDTQSKMKSFTRISDIVPRLNSCSDFISYIKINQQSQDIFDMKFPLSSQKVILIVKTLMSVNIPNKLNCILENENKREITYSLYAIVVDEDRKLVPKHYYYFKTDNKWMIFNKKQGIDKQLYLDLEEEIELELYQYKQTCKFYLFYKLESSPLYANVIFDDFVNCLNEVKEDNIEGLIELMKWNNDKVKSNIDNIIECFKNKGKNYLQIFEEYITEYFFEEKEEFITKIKLKENQQKEENLGKDE